MADRTATDGFQLCHPYAIWARHELSAGAIIMGSNPIPPTSRYDIPANYDKEYSMATGMKECKRHNGGKGAQLKRDDFPKDAKQPDGKSVWCKECWKDYRAEKLAEKNGGKKVKTLKQVRTETKAAVRAEASAKSKGKAKTEKKSPAKKAKTPEESIPKGVKVRDIAHISDLPKDFMLFEWVGFGEVEERIASFEKVHGFKPKTVFRFGVKHWIETKVPVQV